MELFVTTWIVESDKLTPILMFNKCIVVCVCGGAYNDGKKTFESAPTLVQEGVRSWRLNVLKGVRTGLWKVREPLI
jgi:hypothetical protein